MTTSRAMELASRINSQMGKGTVKMGNDPYFIVEYLPTGIDPIDDLLQGGLPFGRFTEIFGDYSTLKTYIGLKAIERCQKMGKLAGLIDNEHAFDPVWAKMCGVKVDDLVLKHAETGEEAIDVAELLIRGGVDLIVFDSVAAALPKAERDTKMSGDKNMQPARQAQLMSQAMRKLTAPNKKTGVLWINQTRVNVGVMFGSNETTPGGKALGFYASQRIALRKAGKVFEKRESFVVEDGKPVKKTTRQAVAVTIRATLEKSKLNQPHREVLFNFDFRKGEVDQWWYLLTLALEDGVVAYDRGFYWVTKTLTGRDREGKKYRGREAFQKAVDENRLRALLNRDGAKIRVKKKAETRNGDSSKVAERADIQGQVQGGSKRTVRTKRQSTK